MKKYITLFMTAMLSLTAFSQQDPVQQVFDKYMGQDGFISLTLTGDMLRMAAQIQEAKMDTALESSLNQVRILVQEKESRENVNFYDELYNQINRSDYQELMTVQEGGQDVSLMAREQNGVISEFILLVGGEDDNVVIHATGNILLRELGQMGANYNMMGFDQLRNFNSR